MNVECEAALQGTKPTRSALRTLPFTGDKLFRPDPLDEPPAPGNQLHVHRKSLMTALLLSHESELIGKTDLPLS